MKAREPNEVPTEPARVHWDFLLEEAKIVRDEMHLRRKFFIEVALRAVGWAYLGWYERKRRIEGKPATWARYEQTFANVLNVTDEEITETAEKGAKIAAREAARLIAIQRQNRASGSTVDFDEETMVDFVELEELPDVQIMVTAPTPKTSERIEMSVRARYDLLTPTYRRPTSPT